MAGLPWVQIGLLVGTALVLGGSLFPLLVGLPESAPLRNLTERRLGWLVGAGALLVLGAGLADLLRLGGALADTGPLTAAALSEAGEIVRRTAIGKQMLARALAGLPVWLGLRAGWRWSFVLALPLLLMVTLLSHRGGEGAAGVSAGLHLAATGAWFGGLVALWLLPLPRLQPPEAATLVARFARLGLAAMAVLALTGIGLAALRMYGLLALVEHPYGEALLVKLGFLAGVLVLAAAARFWVQPRLGDGPGPVRRLRWLLGAEAALGLAVLVAAAALSITPAALTEPLRLSVIIGTGGLEPATLVVTPNRPVLLTVVNRGTGDAVLVVERLPHDMVGGAHEHGEESDMPLVVPGGGQGRILFVPRREGEYPIAIGPHGGLVGSLQVRYPDSGP